MDDNGFAVRPAAAHDAGFLGDMLVEAVNWSPDRRIPRTDILGDPLTGHYVSGWPRPGDLGAIATADGGRIGAAWLRLFPEDDPGYGFVAPDVPELSIGVAAPWRGRGVGRALLRAAVRRAGEAGFGRISLSVERANGAARWYAHEGFTTVRSGPDSDTMVKLLAPVP
ncbi:MULTISPECIES: GNAT family N-acetyltransferase [Streptomyces]|uniref:GNAT family N-acetyltransferase n=1 Tax=Streptomyces lycii TaxID=2654337 RepID=A0ABQ7FRQ3_9ACTN|nr:MULTISPECIES: GNAT family N-acetyltransferase [Streptomyces]KAF4410138.1 GNAT family N-acetyltransferase [Streptomyces lycii]PGH49780.1 N-acetyltransferase [Streptomyces sp. Ru87]